MSDPSGRPVFQVGQAFSWAASSLRGDFLPFIVLAALPMLFTAAQGIGTTSLQNVLIDCINPQSPGQENACAAALSPAALAPVLLSMVLVFAAYVAQLGVIRGAVGRMRGRSPSFADMLEPANTGSFVLYVLVFRLLFFVGLALCILPGLLVLVFFQFGPYFILDRGMSARQAARASARLAARNLGPVAVVAMIAGLLELIGGLFFGIPLLLTLPFAALFTAWAYRQLSDDQLQWSDEPAV